MKRHLVILFALLVSILHLVFYFSSWGESLEPLALDLWFNIRGSVEPPDDVVIVSMDEESYDVLGIPLNQAWPRKLHAELLERLAELGAKRVAMDILFLGPSDPESDAKLATAMKKVPTAIGADVGLVDRSSSSSGYSLEKVLFPELFRDSAAAVGLVQMPIDGDRVRRFYPKRTAVTRDMPTLFEAAAGIKRSPETTPGERDFIRYYGPASSIPTYPYHQVLNPKGGLPKELFANKTVFVGLNLRTELGPAQKDTFKTPFFHDQNVWGVEILATSAANIINRHWIHRSSSFTEGIGLFIGAWVLAGLIFFLKPQWAGLLILSSGLLWGISSYFLFLSGLYLPGGVLFLIFLPLAYLASTLSYYMIVVRSQQQVEKAFQLYLSPEMAAQMRSNPAALNLGGETIHATALFSDIQDFTEITEKMLATEVSQMLNAYFTEVMEVVFQNQGTLIKFIGDAVFVLWGAPIKLSDHARRATATALAIQKEVEKFNASKRFPPLHTRVGVHTGPMVVGNLGSARRFDYTAIGDSVNLASRIEGTNKYFGTKVLITESTRRELDDTFSPFSLGSIRVSGKKQAMELYTLFNTAVSESVTTSWEKALRSFRQRHWDKARSEFEAIMPLEPRLEKSCSLYINQCNNFAITPPSEDWNGEITFLQK